MPLRNAHIRQEAIEDALLVIDSIEINTNSPEEIGKSVMKAVETSLDILSDLSLNVRDVIMLLNRQNPDLLPVGPYPVAEPGAEVEPGTEQEEPERQFGTPSTADSEVEPGTEPGEKNQ